MLKSELIKTLHTCLNSLLKKDRIIENCLKEMSKYDKKEIIQEERKPLTRKFRQNKRKITVFGASQILGTSEANIHLLFNSGILGFKPKKIFQKNVAMIYEEDVYDFGTLLLLYQRALEENLIFELKKHKKVYRILDTSKSQIGHSQRILLLELFTDYFGQFFDLRSDIKKFDPKKYKKYIKKIPEYEKLSQEKLDQINKYFYKIERLIHEDLSTQK